MFIVSRARDNDEPSMVVGNFQPESQREQDIPRIFAPYKQSRSKVEAFRSKPRIERGPHRMLIPRF